MVRNSCPLCGSENTMNLLRADNWEIAFCMHCSNGWTEPPPVKIRYDEEDFHSQFRYREVEDLPTQWKKATMMQADLLTKFLKPGSKILEIGCGEGIFLKELRRRGFKVTGIEPSARASQRARDAGLDVICGCFPESRIKGPFSAVVAIQVLEHIAHPQAFLKEVQDVAAGGFALFVQTNWRGLVPRLQKRRWYAWVPEQHFWHFTPKGIAFLFRKVHWRILKLEFSSLHHGGSLISKLGAVIPGFGDQFHVLAKIP